MSLGGRLINAGTEAKWAIPYTNTNFIFGIEGELFALGVNGKIEDGRLKIGASALIGGDLITGFERKECAD